MSLFGNRKLDSDLVTSIEKILEKNHVNLRPELSRVANSIRSELSSIELQEDKSAFIKQKFKENVNSLEEYRNIHIMNEFFKIATK